MVDLQWEKEKRWEKNRKTTNPDGGTLALVFIVYTFDMPKSFYILLLILAIFVLNLKASNYGGDIK